MHCLELPEFQDGLSFWKDVGGPEYVIRVLAQLYPYYPHEVTRVFRGQCSDFLVRTYPPVVELIRTVKRIGWDQAIFYVLSDHLYCDGYRGSIKRVLESAVSRYTPYPLDRDGFLLEGLCTV